MPTYVLPPATEKNCAKIIGIQFSILSPEEIRKGSVAEITSRNTYDAHNKPVIGGLFDPRMGVLEPGLICPTDGLDYMKTPGFAGHLELARPVFYIQYLPIVLKVLRCVCFKCSKLLISKEKYKQALKMPCEERWSYVCSLVSNNGKKTGSVKRCGDETSDGCGCPQPLKIRKESFSKILAEWKDTAAEDASKTVVINLTPEMAIKILKRISDEDVVFMGFSPIYSRPEWMICQVMLVSPPAVRPSVKHDAQQRSEDDLSHILVNIIKTNKTLHEKMNALNPSQEIIDSWTELLQYFIAMQVDNKIPGIMASPQRSGRPSKSIKDRLTGKGGRMRGNLMAKRVDFSARSVITADPNISIRELGIPMKIAMNITKPVIVNKLNRSFLTQLVRNGHKKWPGAKILERKNGGDSVTLRFFEDRTTLVLEDGDIVHRHMMDGDAVLFNRQPSLHRMSMMCHLARIMHQGDTFRMNVADTKPYNADFDGDEMNLHMPQDLESEAELKQLAAVPYQIISPANNSSIIGIYQDSMLGCYQFTRENVRFSRRDAMNLLMMFERVDADALLRATTAAGFISNFDILSQIMPPLSMKYKLKMFKEEIDDKATSNHILEIQNGKYLRGQIDKSVLGAATRGLLHRTCNDFGNMASSNFIDDLQNIVTEYMCSSSFSVGVSDLIIPQSTTMEITRAITEKKKEVMQLIQKAQLGAFENNTGKTTEAEFEIQVNNCMKQAQSESGSLGLKALSKTNRFITMVNSGSKGSELNITLMTACIGQQEVDAKRIPYGFDNRTLPHFSKYDDSPGARGFVESSYINGLTPQELFFHAMGGRVGLIDTAVKTSTTGYIQRRLIKGLEDLMVSYDMTVRSNKNKIVQFSYGDDNIDTIKVENQILPLVSMSIQDIYAHFLMPTPLPVDLHAVFAKNVQLGKKMQVSDMTERASKYIDFMIEMKSLIIKNVFKFKTGNCVHCPVAFAYIIDNIQGQCSINARSLVDISPNETFDLIEECFDNLKKIHYAPPTDLFKTLFFYYLAPKQLLFLHRFNRAAVVFLLATITLHYKRAIVAPGEMVGMLAGQSIGEISTQMTLNTFHYAGVSSKSNVTRGVPRLEEIFSLSTSIKNPSLSIYLKPDDEIDKTRAMAIMNLLEHTRLEEIVKSVEICFDPKCLGGSTDADMVRHFRTFEEDIMDESLLSDGDGKMPPWVIRLEMDPEIMLDKNITMDDVNFTLNNIYDTQISCVFSDYNEDLLIFRIRMNGITPFGTTKSKQFPKTLDQSDNIFFLKNFQDQLMQNVVLRGVKGLNKVTLRKIKDNIDPVDFKKQDIWVLDTVGTNLLEILGIDYIDNTRTFSNSIMEVYNVLGIEAARQSICNELAEVIEFDSSYINYHNYSVLIDRMSSTYKLISICRHGINHDNIGPIAKASFEETPEMFLGAARHAELDTLTGISANVMCGQEGMFGTSAFQVILNIDELISLGNESEFKYVEKEARIEELFGSASAVKAAATGSCEKADLMIENKVNFEFTLIGEDTEYDVGF